MCWNQGRKCREISAIYRVSEASETTFRGDMSEGWFFAKNRQKISDISAIGDKLPIYSKSCLGSPFIADFLVIFSEKSPLSLQRDLTTQITLVLIRRPDLNLNVNKEIQWPDGFQIVIQRPYLNPNINKEIQRPDCFQTVIQRPKLNFNGNLRFQRLFWPKFRL